jgi:hypothetical protein
LGAVAINLSDGITDPAPIEIQVKRAMRRSANKIVLLIDSSKFGKRSLAEIFPIAEIDVLVTERMPQRKWSWGSDASVLMFTLLNNALHLLTWLDPERVILRWRSAQPLVEHILLAFLHDEQGLALRCSLGQSAIPNLET